MRARAPQAAWALAAGMDTLLVHMFGRPAALPADASPDLDSVDWHPQAQVDFFGLDLDVADDPIATTIHIVGSLRMRGGAAD